MHRLLYVVYEIRALAVQQVSTRYDEVTSVSWRCF